jgi:hypothetical protein
MKRISVRLRFVSFVMLQALLMIVPDAVCEAGTKGISKSDNVIRIWSVGSPFTRVLPQTTVPLELERQAEVLGFKLTIENVRAAEFPDKLREAVQAHTQPEILTFDNFGVIVGVNTPTGRYPGVLNTDYGIASSLEMVYESFATLQPRHWWVTLVRSAANYEAARTLAMRPPSCLRETQAPSSIELKAAMETATQAAHAYLACDGSALTAFSDESKLGGKCFLPQDTVRVEAIQPCGVVGNNRLAFVSLASTFVARRQEPPPTRDPAYSRWLMETALGQQTVLAVLRKQTGGWRLFAISDDPIDTDGPTFFTLERLAGLLTNETADISTPLPARLVTAEGTNLRPPPYRPFGNFEWIPSESPEVVCEVAEFLVGEGADPRERTRLLFFLRHENSLSSGKLWGTTGHWRMWSINKAGNVSLSESRSYLKR